MPSTNTPHASHCPRWMEEAVYKLVHRSSMPAYDLAARSGISESLAYSYGTFSTNRSQKHRCMPLHRFVVLTQNSRNKVVLDEICRYLGCTVPEWICAPGDRSVEELLVSVNGALGQGIERMMAALEDLRVEPHEEQQVLAAFDRIRALMSECEARIAQRRNGAVYQAERRQG